MREIEKKTLKEVDNEGPWTIFWDMHSGGGSKEENASGFHRHCKWDRENGKYLEVPDSGYKKGTPLVRYVNQEGVLIIEKKDIMDSDKTGAVPEQGYVWVE